MKLRYFSDICIGASGLLALRGDLTSANGCADIQLGFHRHIAERARDSSQGMMKSMANISVHPFADDFLQQLLGRSTEAAELLSLLGHTYGDMEAFGDEIGAFMTDLLCVQRGQEEATSASAVYRVEFFEWTARCICIQQPPARPLTGVRWVEFGGICEVLTVLCP